MNHYMQTPNYVFYNGAPPVGLGGVRTILLEIISAGSAEL